MRVAFVPVWHGNPYHVELVKSLGAVGVDVLCPQSLKTLYRDVLAGAEKVDVLHLHALPSFGWSPRSLARYALSYCRLVRLRELGIRLVWTVHNFRNHDSKNWLIEDHAGRRFSPRLHALIVHGDAAKQIVESRWRGCVSDQLRVIPHGNYIRSYKNDIPTREARALLGSDPSNLVFLFMGLIRPYKGVAEMVKAFRACADSNARLVIAGRPVDAAIGNEVELSIEGDSRIRFVPGHVNDDDIQIYMNACDVVVLPYKRVFTSGTAVLAMSFGKPCIAPRVGCVPDMLDDEGAVFFDPEAKRDLERAFRRVLACPERLPGMGRHNLERAKGWDWGGIGRATAAVYEQCVAAEKRQIRPVSVRTREFAR
jgi:beta-1,4-mannosyltransferase